MPVQPSLMFQHLEDVTEVVCPKAGRAIEGDRMRAVPQVGQAKAGLPEEQLAGALMNRSYQSLDTLRGRRVAPFRGS